MYEQSKETKASFHHRLLNNDRQNSRKFWNTIKSIFPTKPKNTIPNFVDNTERANKFGSYFSNIVRKLKNCAYPLTNFTWKYPRKRSLTTDKIFCFSYISTAFVEKEIRQLKRNKGNRHRPTTSKYTKRLLCSDRETNCSHTELISKNFHCTIVVEVRKNLSDL